MNRPQSRPINTNTKIEMPPLDQINQITASIEAERVPAVQQFVPSMTQQQQYSTEQTLDFPVVAMDNLPTYEPEYNPQEVELPTEFAYDQQQQYTATQQLQSQQQYQQPQHMQQQHQEESVGARNFREMRMQMAQRDREIEELRQLINAQKQAMVQQKTEEEAELDINFDPEDLANGAHLNTMYKELKAVKKQLKQTQQQSEEAKKQAYKADVEQHLRRMYPDFDSVLSPENVEKFAQQYGALAKSIANDPDYLNQCSAAYTAIKNTGIAAAATYQPQIDKIKQNMAKPRPLTSIAPQQAESPLARANAFAEGLTPELQKSLVAEMNQARRRI